MTTANGPLVAMDTSTGGQRSPASERACDCTSFLRNGTKPTSLPRRVAGIGARSSSVHDVRFRLQFPRRISIGQPTLQTCHEPTTLRR